MSDLPPRSPYHKGEQSVQERTSVRERAERMGSRMIRDHLIAQHRLFYAQLPFVVVAAVDEDGRPWASLLGGWPGFLSTPDAQTLRIDAHAVAGDPVQAGLREGADIGVLGMQLETRRRNRLSGRITQADAVGLTLHVDQSFGNCPQYIQTREVSPRAPLVGTPEISHTFDADTAALISAADTLFIASAYRTEAGDTAQGADASHRGGKPGFVHVLDERRFLIPDFAGNNAFNTLGNLAVNPRAGMVFADFEKGDLVSMTGTTEILWDDPAVARFEGAFRAIRFTADEIHRLPGALPIRTTFGAYAPQLERLGGWS